jgi:hypothetical protein
VGAAVGARQPKYLPEHCELVAAFYLEAKHDGVRRDNVYIADALSEAWGESVTRKVAEQLVEGPVGAGTAPRDVMGEVLLPTPRSSSRLRSRDQRSLGSPKYLAQRS